MNDIDQFEQPHDATTRRALTEEERRNLLEKRIRDLRKKKRREQRRAKRPVRITVTILLAALVLLFLFSSIYVLSASGGDQGLRVIHLPASNLTDFEELTMAADGISVPDIPALAAILVEPATGDVLYEKNADQSVPMASTTKVMTAIVTLEHANLEDSTTVSADASAVGESSAWLQAGEVLTVEQLLHALMLQSGNDASVVLAEHVAGSEAAFVEMMNAKAQELGLEHSSFSNPHGLDAQGHYTSARDLASIASYAMTIPKFREIVATPSYEIPWPGNPYPRVMENHNRLLKMYSYATGIKTGYTLGAGLCLAASAQKDGRELISVILNGGESYWDQTISLMEYGFNDFVHVEYTYAGQPLAEVEVGDFPRRKIDAVTTEDPVFTVRRDRLESYMEASIHSREWVPYPVAAGQEVGYMVLAEGTPHEASEVLVSSQYRNTPNFLLRIIAFIAAVVCLLWKCILWLIPGL